MFIEILEYIGIIALVLTALASYNQYKAGKFNKDYVEVEDSNKKQSKFQKWWQQSYLREVYVVRAGQRKGLCFIPWLGVWVSLFAVFVFIIFNYMTIFHPLQPLEKLTKYEGVIENYYTHQKSDDRLQIKLKDGTIKSLHANINWKIEKEKEMGKKFEEWSQEMWDNLINSYKGKKIMVLVQRDWGISDLGYYEDVVWMEIEGKPFNEYHKSYEEKYNSGSKFKWYETIYIIWLITSLKWLLGFLALLWFINRNPIETTNKINKKD